MFGMGTWEILLILVAALIFIGPDKLPKVAKSIGRGMRQVRDAMNQVDDEVRGAGRSVTDQVRSEFDEVRGAGQSVTDQVRSEIDGVAAAARHEGPDRADAVAKATTQDTAQDDGTAGDSGGAPAKAAPSEAAPPADHWSSAHSPPAEGLGRVAAARPDRPRPQAAPSGSDPDAS